MSNKLLRVARNQCRMRTYDVRRQLGIRASYLGDVERGRDLFDKATYARLWDFYEANEQPARFEGVYKTVTQLRSEWEMIEEAKQ